MLFFARRLIAVLGLLVAFSESAAADGLFVPLVGQQAVQAAAVATPQLAVRRSRDVALDPAYLAATIAPEGVDQQQGRLNRVPAPTSVRIELFTGVAVDLERSAISEVHGGGFIWTGAARGPVAASANLVIRDGRITGLVSVMGEQPTDYRIDPLAIGRMHRISEMDGGAYPPDLHPEVGDHDHAHPTDQIPQENFGVAETPSVQSAADTVTTVDVLIAYTSAAANAYGDISAQANLAISLANSAFNNSNVQIQYRLVGTTLVSNYAEGSFPTMLEDLGQGTLPQFQAVHALRDSIGADLVAMLVSSVNQYCGYGYIPNIPSASTAYLGFSVSAVPCISGHTFTHELGHNFGLSHDRYALDKYDHNNPPSSQYQFGFVSVPGRFMTIMSYRDQCEDASVTCTRLNRFSSADQSYNGRATGISAGSAGAADAARWLNEVREGVASYRPTAGGPTGPANDLFADRITITAPGTVNGTNVGATAEPGQPDMVAAASAPNNNAVWWRFTPTQNGTLTIDTCGSDFDSTLGVFTGAAVDALTSVAFSDDSGSCSPQSSVTFDAVAGRQYQIGVAGYNNVEGTIRLSLALLPVAATTDTGLDAPTSGTVGESLTFSAAVTSSAGTPGGTVSFRRDGIEFASGTLNASGLVSVSSAALPEGTYQITAQYLGNASYSASTSVPQTLTISPAPTGPANNLFANRITIGAPGTVTGTNIGATSEPGQPDIAVAGSRNAVWWRFTPVQNGTLTIDTCGSDFDTTLAVFTGAAVDSLTGLGSNDDACVTQSRVALAAQAGIQYQIAVAGYADRTGAITLTLSLAPTASPTVTALDSPSSGTVGQSLSFTATVTSAGGTPDGVVSFRRDGTEFAAGTLDAGGTARASSDSLAEGSYQITARYLGSAGFDASTSAARTLTILAAPAMQPQIATGGAHSCALSQDQSLYCWGSNGNGQLGDGTTTNRTTPVAIGALGHSVSQIATGQTHTCALRNNGRVFCWGSNGSGQLGDGTVQERHHPVRVAGLGHVTQIATGLTHTCALRDTGRVFCWGANAMGQLGDGTSRDRSRPVRVAHLGRVTAIAVGDTHTCALRTNGLVFCWGGNDSGQIGDGTTTARPAPVRVPGTGIVAQIAAGQSHSCALRNRGTVFCWGANGMGQLGDATTADQLRPVLVLRLSRVTQISAGRNHSCALRETGLAYCWGANSMGQLGDGTTIDRHRRVSVLSFAQGLQVAAGGEHGCALQTHGTALCWGSNGSGQLGDGTTTNRTSPVSVALGSLAN